MFFSKRFFTIHHYQLNIFHWIEQDYFPYNFFSKDGVIFFDVNDYSMRNKISSYWVLLIKSNFSSDKISLRSLFSSIISIHNTYYFILLNDTLQSFYFFPDVKMSRSQNDAISERRLRPIYDWLDNGNNKKALQEADKVFKYIG